MPAEVVFPASLRPAGADVQFEPIDIARSVPMDQGEMRRRPRFRTVPQVADVGWTFEQAAFDMFWDWYEDELRAAEREFDIQLERQGGPGAGDNPRLQWWTAKFAETPKHQVRSGYRYFVSAKLMLLGSPADARTPLGARAAGGNFATGGWMPTSSPIVAQGANTSGGGWLHLAPGASTRAAGSNVSEGGWAQLNLPILASGSNLSTGGWLQPNGVLAEGLNGTSGGLVQLNLPILAAGANEADGGWEGP